MVARCSYPLITVTLKDLTIKAVRHRVANLIFLYRISALVKHLSQQVIFTLCVGDKLTSDFSKLTSDFSKLTSNFSLVPVLLFVLFVFVFVFCLFA